jgi:hypothetical protein
MFIAVHAAVAIAATQSLASPALAGAIGVASHFVLDTIPHGDDHLFDGLRARGWSARKFVLVFGAADGAAWVAVAGWLTFSGAAAASVAIAAAAGAALPDVLWGLAALLPSVRTLRWFEQLHLKAHRLLGRGLVRPWLGYGVQLAALAAAILLVQR